MSELRNKKEEVWLAAMLDMKEIMTKFNCSYFLNTGTLLGAIRDNGFIPWDNDIDIAVVNFECDPREIKDISKAFYRKGYNVTSVTDCINISDGTGLLDLGIKFYSHDGDYYCAHQGRMEGSKLMASIGLFLSETFLYKNGYGKFKILALIANCIHIFKFLVPRTMRERILQGGNIKTVEIQVPEYFLDTFEDYELYGQLFKVPMKNKEYLKYRYGDNWMKPQKNYNFMTDDGGIQS